ncbi:MAG TPA: LCP family protein [Chloroflexota bacterium]|nr:LCP family protein [Chloroflexota bacterium]
MPRPPRRRGPNRLSLILLAVFFALLLGAGVTAFKTLTFASKVSTAGLGDNIRSIVTNAAPSPSSPDNPATQAQMAGRINVLLMGYGGGGHDGAYLTDSMMVLTLDQQTKKAAMISVPRDIWVKIPYSSTTGAFSKLNAAYAIGVDDQGFPNKAPEYKGAAGGGALASTVVGGILGIKIDYWVAVDFHAFRSVVDSLGGVDVNVEKTFTDPLYPRNDDPTIDAGWMTVHFNAGLQHMTGERAIEYARSRHSLQDGTDFGRSRRQQLLLLAIKNKALTPEGATKVFGLMDALSSDFKTNMNIGQIRALADLAKTVDPAALQRVSIDNTNFLVDAESGDGQAVLVAQAKSWLPLRSYIAGLLLDPAIKTENATVQLWNASGLSGAAGTATSMLHDIGLQTLPPQNVDSGAIQQNDIHDFSQGKDASTVNYLASLFGAKVINDTPTPADRADIKVILGRSYEQPALMVDTLDTGVRPLGYAPPVVETPKPTVKPGASGTPAASIAAIATATPAASVRAPVRAAGLARPAASASPTIQPRVTATAVRR